MATPITYASAGVDIDAGNHLVQRIKSSVVRTHRPEVLGSLGGFAGCFAPNLSHMQEPVLVSCTDGVGTKLRLALDQHLLSGIGIDCVAMCANDLVVMGAEPLFFLDYYATGKLNPDMAAIIIDSIATGCQQAGMALLGGETAEMPGLYQQDDFDLAGFCVGVVDKTKLIDGRHITPSDALIAIGSSGAHSNGYSLIRRCINNDTPAHLVKQFLEPTKIYVKPILALAAQNWLKGAAHITGGGLSENIPRMLPPNTRAEIKLGTWQLPECFAWLKQQTHLPFDEFQRVFNCGVGMVCCVAAENTAATLSLLQEHGEHAWHIGNISPGNQDIVLV